MDFGKLAYVDEIDFTLPPDDKLTDELWERIGSAQSVGLVGSVSQVPAGAINCYVGCTQWGRKDWVGKVYPVGTKERDFLMQYARQFNCIELNAMFYNLQPKEVIERWVVTVESDMRARGAVRPEGFRFCPKFTNVISHTRQLRNAERETGQFIDHLQSFGAALGPSFLQLSESFGPDRASILWDYLRYLPGDFKACVELRHPDWFGAAVSDTWRLLRELGIGTVITDTAGRRDVLHMRLTTPVAFIRFVANNLHPTDYTRIEIWADRISTWISKGLKEIYFIVHSPDESNVPELCKYVVEQFNQKCGTSLKPPVLFNGAGTNLSLF